MHQIVCRLGLCPRPNGGAYIAPLAGLGVGPTGNGKEGWEGKGGRERKGGEGVPECPNPELASLDVPSTMSAAQRLETAIKSGDMERNVKKTVKKLTVVGKSTNTKM